VKNAIAAAGIALAQMSGQIVDAPARQLLERSQAAVVIDRSLRDLRSLLLKGRLRVAQEGDTSLDGVVEIRIVLPDRYLRVDTLDGSERRSGFAGRTVLTPGGDIRVEQARLTQLMLGSAAYLLASPRLSVRSTGEGAFPDTAAVDVTGPGYSMRLVVDVPSYLPLRLVSSGDRRGSTVVSFANRRPVGGINLPFRVTTQTAERVLETLMFDEILVNPDLPESDFRK
jgi:hypothetical protein